MWAEGWFLATVLATGVETGFWMGWGANDFISHKVCSGGALTFHCYFSTNKITKPSEEYLT